MPGRVLIYSAAALGLSACQSSVPALESSLSADFGDATRHNIAVQAIEPTPSAKADTYIPADPAVQTRARAAYRDGNVEEPRQLRTGGN